MTHLSISEARTQLTRLAGRLRAHQETVEVTSRGKPVLAIVPWDLYESMVETMEIMGDKDLMAKVRQGIKDYEAGNGVPLEAAKKRLGL